VTLLLLLACSTKLDDSGAAAAAVAPPLSVGAAELLPHLQDLSALQVDGTRALGGEGYSASVALVMERLEDAGYSPEARAFEIQSFQQAGPSVLSIDGSAWQEGPDFALMQYSGSGDVTAPIAAVDLTLPPGADNSSTSGCEASDFDGFTPGHVALIQRGTCTFAEKAANAEAAGAAAVVLFNEGQEGRTDALAGTLDPDAPSGVPVLGATFAVGEAMAALAEESPGAEARVAAATEVALVETWNVIAETAGGDPDAVLMLGAHLDSVGAGPGINDNGSGTALVLELALQLADPARDAALQQRVRFGFWGAEEIGLVGSTRYVEALSTGEREQLVGYLNFDMIGSPNYVRYVYDEDGQPEGSRAFEKMLRASFDERGLDYELSLAGGRSDHAPFAAVGIPIGGLFTGAEVEKSEAEAATYGGEADVPLDPCYHLACDTLENVSSDALDEMAPAGASALWVAASTRDWMDDAAARRPGDRPRASGPVDRQGHDYWGRELRR